MLPADRPRGPIAPPPASSAPGQGHLPVLLAEVLAALDPARAPGPVLDGSILSDDYVEDAEVRYRPCFTGAFVGLCCQDLSGQRLHADFDGFEYRELDAPEMASH